MAGFLVQMREAAKTLGIPMRERSVRRLVKEILVDDDKIVIRRYHSDTLSCRQ
jgi:hypothetical protein